MQHITDSLTFSIENVHFCILSLINFDSSFSVLQHIILRHFFCLFSVMFLCFAPQDHRTISSSIAILLVWNSVAPNSNIAINNIISYTCAFPATGM